MGDAKPEETHSPPTVKGGGPGVDPDVTLRGDSTLGEPPILPLGAFDPPRDRFVELKELGRGGMGRVVDAFDRALARSVAVKTIHTDSSVDLARFEREAQITARLEHPGIVPIYDAGRDEEGRPYYVMRKVDGRPLDEMLVDRPALDDRLALVPNLLAACDAVAFAHARGVIHRDIKPTNILVGAFGETLVIDWGLARKLDVTTADKTGEIPVSDPNLTRVGQVAGTPGFMAPEQARGEVVDARADVYALGATLFYVLAGKLPFATTSATEMIALSGGGAEPAWSRIPPEVPADLMAIVKKAMAPADGGRYEDANELAADLRRFVTGKFVGAHRYGVREQLRRFIRRNRAAVAIASVAILVIAVGGALSVRRVLAERDDARRARAISEQAALDALDRNDAYLVQHAFDLLDTDPVQTIAVLRQLRPTSTQWRAAAIAAAAAHSRGIPMGFAFGERLRHFAFSPSANYVLARAHDDELWLVDLRTRTRRSLGVLESEELDWIDDERWLAGAAPTGIQLVDVVSGTRRFIPTGTAVELYYTRDGSAYAKTKARTLHRIDGTSTSLGPALADQIDSIVGVVGYGAAIVRAGRIHLVSPAGLQELPGAYAANDRSLLHASVDAVIAYLDAGTCLFRLAGTPRLDECKPGPPTLAGTNADDGIVTHGSGVIRSYARGKTATLRTGEIRAVYPSARGYAVILDDGALWLREGGRWLDIGRRTNGANRALVSDHGEWLGVDTDGGELMIYDLDQVRPRIYPAQMGTRLAALTATDVWVAEMFDGLVRIDRVTGERDTVMAGPMVGVALSESMRWGTSNDPMQTHASLVDTVARKRITVKPDHFAMPGTDPPYASDPQGELYAYASGEPRRIASLGSTVRYVHTAGNVSALALAGQQLCQLRLATGDVRCIGLPEVAQYAISEPSGTVWGASSSVIYRWDGVTLMRFPMHQTVRGLMRTEHYLVSLGATSVGAIDLQTFVVRELPAPTVQHASTVANDQLLIVLSSGALGVFDVMSGRSYDRASSVIVEHALYAYESTYATVRTTENVQSIDVYEVTVPTEPAALQRWLHDITNMRDVPGSEVVTWP